MRFWCAHLTIAKLENGIVMPASRWICFFCNLSQIDIFLIFLYHNIKNIIRKMHEKYPPTWCVVCHLVFVLKQSKGWCKFFTKRTNHTYIHVHCELPPWQLAKQSSLAVSKRWFANCHVETAHCNADGLQRAGRHFAWRFLCCVLASGPKRTQWRTGMLWQRNKQVHNVMRLWYQSNTNALQSRPNCNQYCLGQKSKLLL